MFMTTLEYFNRETSGAQASPYHDAVVHRKMLMVESGLSYNAARQEIHMRLLPKVSNNRGDTIVEVMIALMIISLILVGAYNVSNRSTREVRTSQEHSTLLLAIQGQIEQVRALARDAEDTSSGVFSVSPKYFCIDMRSGSATYGQRVDFPASMTTLPNGDHIDTSSYPDACKDIEGLYAIAINYNPPPLGNNTFDFTGQWDTLGGAKGQEQLAYRVYPGGSNDVFNGNADIGTSVCPKDPTTGDCVVGPPKTGPVVAHWGTSFENLSSNPGLEVESCEWDFGDGSVLKSPPSNMKYCQFGQQVGHVYTPPSPLPPVSVLCNPALTPDTVITLTMHFKGGFTATKTATKHIPVCYRDS